MADGILGRKIGMTSLMVEGQSIPVTVIEAGPCPVVQVKSAGGPDKYDALQLGFLPAKKKRTTLPVQGHFAKVKVEPTRILREFRGMSGHKTGETIRVGDIFTEGDVIMIRGRSKGRGFSGVIKRHGFHGHKASHGTHESFRGAGSIGACAWPSRVVKGKRMPGHYGVDKVTIKNVEVVEIVAEKNLLLVKGAVPGARNSVVELIKQ